MTDSMHQPRDENGQFVSLREFVERIFVERERELENERLLTRETAKRLEREVEETAQRIESGVDTALRAVAETTAVHAEAHSREHMAHERIHNVEKFQVDKAEVQRERDANKLAEQLLEYKKASNEWRDALGDQRGNSVSRELFDAQDRRIQQIEKRLAYYAGATAVIGAITGVLIRYVTT